MQAQLLLCELAALERRNTNHTWLSFSLQEMEISVPHHIQIHESLGLTMKYKEPPVTNISEFL